MPEDTDHVVDYINEGILQELREAYGQIIPDAVRICLWGNVLYQSGYGQ